MEKDRIVEEQYLSRTIQILRQNIADCQCEEENQENIFNTENEKYLSSMKDMNLNTLSEENALLMSNMQQTLEQRLNEVEKLKQLQSIYVKMIFSPYFAKIDIIPEDTNQSEKYYIGTHTLNDKDNTFIVLDWRSPIASIFYDYEVGDAKIVSDNSTLDVKLTNKRQFKIEDSQLKYFFDTNVAIEDELLQDALGQNSSNSMKSIVQTIQAEQNKVIRSPEGVNLVVNGVAGSGKTAIALHRIAYLLYKLKGKLTSDSVLVLSHNNAFSSYISQVLPDLAEQDVSKVVLDALCRKHLHNIADIEFKSDQMDRIINYSGQVDNWKYKISYEFLNRLENYCYQEIANSFEPKTISIMGIIIPQDKISKLYFETYKEQSTFTRICWIADALVNDYFYNVKSAGALKRIKVEIFEQLMSFVPDRSPVNLYIKFLKSVGRDMKLRSGKIKNEDAYPIWFIKMFVAGYNVDTKIQHLIIDEMQEYSAVQLKIVDMLYPCCKTMLGDTTQFVDKLGANNILQNYSNIFNADINNIELNKSYRSTMQITEFFAYLAENKQIEYVKRSGDDVGFWITNDNEECNLLTRLVDNKYNNTAIITKNNKQAIELYNKYNGILDNLHLVSSNKDLLQGGVTIISAFNSKGLEFDQVIVYNASEENFSTEFENNLLFIASSRAMHRLDIVSKGKFCKKCAEYIEKNNKTVLQ